MSFHRLLILTFLLFFNSNKNCHSFTILRPARTSTSSTSSSTTSWSRRSSHRYFSHDAPSSNCRRILTVHSSKEVDSCDDFVPLNYDDIQNSMIDVSKPYYKLENESAVHMVSSTGFVCTVDPEMPIGREAGSHMPCAEVGRHCAIAGSVAAALNQPACRSKGVGSSTKHYYLALDCQLEVCSSLTHMQDHLFRTQMPIANDLKNKGHVVISAICDKLEKRNASCKMLMQFPTSYGTKPVFYFLRVNYVVMTPKVFQRFSPKSLPPAASANSSKKKQQQPEELLSTSRRLVPAISDNKIAKSPYAQFEGLNHVNCKTQIVSKSKKKVFMTTKIPKIRPESCLGHFEGNPALPIAFLAAFCADICGEAIAALTDTPIPFRTQRTGPTNNVQGGNMLKFESADINAHKLVYAGDHNDGLIITCEVEKHHASEGVDKATDESHNMFISRLFIVAPATPNGPEKEEFIGSMNSTYSLLVQQHQDEDVHDDGDSIEKKFLL